MSGKQISLVYFYIISAVALGLIIIGIFNSVNFFINVTQYKDYPLRFQNEDCSNIFPTPVKAIPPALSPNQYPVPATQSADEVARQKELCQKQLDQQRKKQKLDDLKNSITFSLVGLTLFLIHFPIARRNSQDSK
ncbi:MAG: hypothetical protein NUV73_00710 [Candidatus Daviesbacteria bacterium]|nr:hypothetical protein [Candidatus Daviesbacteria bacterium]